MVERIEGLTNWFVLAEPSRADLTLAGSVVELALEMKVDCLGATLSRTVPLVASEVQAGRTLKAACSEEQSRASSEKRRG